MRKVVFVFLLVLLPLFALAGVEGRIFAPLGMAYAAAIAASSVAASSRHTTAPRSAPV